MGSDEATAVSDVAGSGTPETTDAAAEAVTTMSVKRYPVAPGVQLNVRSGPGTNYEIVKILPLGASVPINCQRRGEWVTGPYGTSNIWDNIANGQYVSDAYVHTGSDGYVAVPC
ncbi:yraI protein [Streptomyces laurentii]|uniref:YraI protein n=1 Tax=Streptomyces laurentii TaxID=39478 RepID=A0A160P1G6_STRLU|nr:yraI protein [Streptomyces laurentii]